MPEHDPAIAGADGSRGRDELPLTQCERLPAHEERDARPVQEADDHDERERSRRPERGDDEEQVQLRDAVQRRDDPGDCVIKRSAEIAGGEAE